MKAGPEAVDQDHCRRASWSGVADMQAHARHIDNVRHPFDDKVLYLTRNGYIGWTCYGSSACRMNLLDLNWTIRNIFEMTPAEFLKTYIEMPIAC